MTSRTVVFQELSNEREYQIQKWNEDATTSDGVHSATEYLVFMQHYLNKAIAGVSTQGDPQATREALDNIRKITALGVACMEQNGVVTRDGRWER